MFAAIQSGTFQKRFSKLLSLFAALVIMATFAQGASAAPAQTAAPPITKILQVQPIIVANDDGSEKARFTDPTYALPVPGSYDYITGKVTTTWEQAGIRVIWLPAKQWKNTLVNFGDPCLYDGHTGTGAVGEPCTGGSRPESDGPAFILQAEAEGVASVGQHNAVIDLYLVRVDPGWPNWGQITGRGRKPNNSMIVGIGDDGWLAGPGGWDAVIGVYGHEIGHNLGLNHINQENPVLDPIGDPNNCLAYAGNLMLSGECNAASTSFDLTAGQIAIALTGPLLPVPALPVAMKVVNNTLGVVQNMSIRKDVKLALALPLGAAKLALEKNKPPQACTTMKVYDASVAYFLSKGQLTASQGRLLNTASKDIRAPIGCQ